MKRRSQYNHFLMSDPRYNEREAWPREQFPDADYTYMKDCGCLICSLAVLLCCHGIETETDEARFNPWILNERLIACGAFYPSGNLEMDDVSRLYPVEYCGPEDYSMELLAERVREGRLCMVTVPGKKGELHFMAVLRMIEKDAVTDAVIFDPEMGERLLSEYDRVTMIRTYRISAVSTETGAEI